MKFSALWSVQTAADSMLYAGMEYIYVMFVSYLFFLLWSPFFVIIARIAGILSVFYRLSVFPVSNTALEQLAFASSWY